MSGCDDAQIKQRTLKMQFRNYEIDHKTFKKDSFEIVHMPYPIYLKYSTKTSIIRSRIICVISDLDMDAMREENN